MKCLSSFELVVLLVIVGSHAALRGEAATAARSVDIVVSAGDVDVDDWVVEQAIDVSSWEPVPRTAAVFELDLQGVVLGQKVSQFDIEDGQAVVTWIADGKLLAQSNRFFRIAFGKDGLDSSERVRVYRQKPALIVEGTGFSLHHDPGKAGEIIRARVGDATIEIDQEDLIRDPEMNYYTTEQDKQAHTRIVAKGPLRAAIEVISSYRDGKGSAPVSGARARYVYTTLLGMGVMRVDAFMEQDSAKVWPEVEVGQFTFDRHFQNWALNIPSRLTNKTTGVLAKKGYHYSADRWAAVYDRDFFMGIFGRTNIVDVKDPRFSCRFRSGLTSWTGLRHRRTVHLFFGGGPQDLEKFRSIAAVLWDPPKTNIVVPQEIQNQLQKARSRVSELRQHLASASVEDYIAGSIVAGNAEQSLPVAEELARRGNFRGAVAKLGLVQEAAEGKVSHALKREGEFLSGQAGSDTIIANRHVSFGFADPKWGAGLTSICDVAARRESLRTPGRKARLWEIALKDDQGKRYLIDSRQGDPSLTVNVNQEKGQITILISWQKMSVGKREAALAVEVRGVLKQDEQFLRWKIKARTLVPDLGLIKTTFPDLSGLKPISDRGELDWIIRPSQLGHRAKSPLRTGQNVSSSVPSSMQFMALTDGRRGLYFCEEDATAAEKYFRFSTGSERGNLDLRVEHPVLNWGAKELQRSYSLPGPFVIGPYCGGWYDACRIYRKWALTAPWCRGGPLAVRKDIPKWIKDIPSWRDQNMGTAYLFEHQKKLALLPYAAHIYHWMEHPGFEGEAPYPEYVPGRTLEPPTETTEGAAPEPEYGPGDGSEWFRKEVKKAQKAGIRVVPYTNGILWYAGLDSFKTTGVRCAVKGKRGGYRPADYDGKQFGVMCPGSNEWWDTVTGFCLQLVENGVDGVYLDQITSTTPSSIWAQCWDESHGHPILGGNWWVEAVRGYMKQVRTTCRQKNPDFLFTSEQICEPLIDSFDIFLETTWGSDSLPLFPAVYGGYAMAFGSRARGEESKELPHPFLLSRWFIWGLKGGWNGIKVVKHLETLLLCYDRFARPFLTYGQMVRPPHLVGDIPKLVSQTGKTLDLPSVEATAWRTLDAQRLGIFIANYSSEARTVTWQIDLAEELGWGALDQIEIRRWDHRALELKTLGKIFGGVLRRTKELGPYEVLVLEASKTFE